MQGKRVNLTLAESDVERLEYWAAREGKGLSTCAADIVRAVLFQREKQRKRDQAEAVTEKLPARDNKTGNLPGIPEPVLTRQQRRAMERKTKNG